MLNLQPSINTLTARTNPYINTLTNEVLAAPLSHVCPGSTRDMKTLRAGQ